MPAIPSAHAVQELRTARLAMMLRPPVAGRVLGWGAFALVLLLAPLITRSGASLSLLSQVGTLMIFGLSYNMLFGQGGMLSFGHAVYSGLGGFAAVHVMNLASGAGGVSVPTSLIPLVGGCAGLFFGMVLGYVTTKRAGTSFSMITLGVVELVFACSLMFPGLFGGEGGVTTNRASGKAFLGISFGPQIQVYYLIAGWLSICAVAMYAFMHTPLGRMSNAVRDNPERAEFVGYDTRWVRYLTLILSAFFAGISGALSAINFEIVSSEDISLSRSGAVLLFTFIGGSGFFFGPMIGAVIGVFFTVLLSDLTKAWQLYLGAFFIAMVMFAPGGIASIAMAHVRLLRHGGFGRVLPGWLAVCSTGLITLAGCVMLVEMLYHHTLHSDSGTVMTLFRVTFDTAQPKGWLIACALMLLGGTGFARCKQKFCRAWEQAQAEVDKQTGALKT